MSDGLVTPAGAETASCAPTSRCRLFVVQPSPFCNIDCDYCYLPDRSNKVRMDEATLRRAFERLFQSGIAREQVSVIWHAGEPLAVPIAWYERAWEIIESLRPKDLRVDESFQTNATLIDDRWCEYFRRRGSGVGVSVDGPAMLNDAHRRTRSGRGTFDRVVKGIETLRRHGIDFHAISVLTWDALEFPDELYEFYLSMGIRRVGFNVEEKEGEHTSSTLDREGIVERYRRFLDRFLVRVAREPGRLEVRELEEARGLLLSPPPDGTCLVNDQADPFVIVSVAADGSFTTFSPEFLGLSGEPYGSFTLGNVHRDAFEDVRATPRFARLVDDIRAGISACKESCAYYAWCGGGAPANKFFENGSLRSSETLYCRLTRKTVIDVVLAHLEGAALPAVGPRAATA